MLLRNRFYVNGTGRAHGDTKFSRNNISNGFSICFGNQQKMRITKKQIESYGTKEDGKKAHIEQRTANTQPESYIFMRYNVSHFSSIHHSFWMVKSIAHTFHRSFFLTQVPFNARFPVFRFPLFCFSASLPICVVEAVV